MKTKTLWVVKEGYLIGDTLISDIRELVDFINDSIGCLLANPNCKDYIDIDIPFMKKLIENGVNKNKLYLMHIWSNLELINMKELYSLKNIRNINSEYDIDEDYFKISRLGTELLWGYYTVIFSNGLKVRDKRNEILKEAIKERKEYFIKKIGKENTEEILLNVNQRMCTKYNLSREEMKSLRICRKLEIEISNGQNSSISFSKERYPMFFSHRSYVEINKEKVYLPDGHRLDKNKYYTLTLMGNFSDIRYFSKESILELESRLVNKRIKNYCDIENSNEKFEKAFRLKHKMVKENSFKEYSLEILNLVYDLVKNKGVYITELSDHIGISFSNSISVYKALEIIRIVLFKNKEIGNMFECLALNRELPEKQFLSIREAGNSNRIILVSELNNLDRIEGFYDRSKDCESDILSIFNKLKNLG